MADPLNVVIDLSHCNEVTSFAQVKAGGILGVVHKATQGSGSTDQTYAARRPQALAAGPWWSAYHLGTNTEGTAQAQHFLSVVNPGPCRRPGQPGPCGNTPTVRTASGHMRSPASAVPAPATATSSMAACKD
jgi:glycosyl hydrolase family 25